MLELKTTSLAVAKFRLTNRISIIRQLKLEANKRYKMNLLSRLRNNRAF